MDKINFCLNPQDNGGEQITIITEITDNGDGLALLNQKISGICYGSFSVELNLGCGSVLTPKILRQLANDIESCVSKKGLSLHEQD